MCKQTTKNKLNKVWIQSTSAVRWSFCSNRKIKHSQDQHTGTNIYAFKGPKTWLMFLKHQETFFKTLICPTCPWTLLYFWQHSREALGSKNVLWYLPSINTDSHAISLIWEFPIMHVFFMRTNWVTLCKVHRTRWRTGPQNIWYWYWYSKKELQWYTKK